MFEKNHCLDFAVFLLKYKTKMHVCGGGWGRENFNLGGLHKKCLKRTLFTIG